MTSLRLVLVPLVLAGLVGCEPSSGSAPGRGRGDVSGSSPRSDAVLAKPGPRAASVEEAPVGDPSPAPAQPAPAAPKPRAAAPNSQATVPKLPQLPFQLPTLPANLRLPFPLPAGLPAIPQGPAIPKAPVVAPQPVTGSRVTVFGIQGCGACSSLKSKLAAKNIPYQYVDLDSAKRESVPHEAFGKVPKTRVIGKSGAVTWVDGDDADKIERAFRS